ncbi:histidine kinase 2-like isoform X1 [Tripterygium wilfordii]|nr:histidine kinase 2-like isoform X1 [Tripterygium wilfordii]
METEDQSKVQECIPEKLDPAPVQDEYAPVIFSQETVSHVVSIDMMSGKEDRENVLRARASGKGVLTSPIMLLKSNHLGVILTFAVYNTVLPAYSTPQQRVEATAGYLGASYDVPSLIEQLLQQLASKQTISVHVYDTTNASVPIKMYGDEITDTTGILHTSNLDFGDSSRKHEMHCRFKQKAPLPWIAISSSSGLLAIILLVAEIFFAAINRIAQMEENCRKMMELKVRAESADVAKSQFLATVSHEIRTPMNGVLGMLQLLMDSELGPVELGYAQDAHSCGKSLISLINGILDQSKIEAGRLELEAVPFDVQYILDNVLSICSNESNKKDVELVAYVSDQVPEIVVGDPGRFQQIITNLVGNSLKFSLSRGHIFVSVHLADEVGDPVRDPVLRQVVSLVEDTTNKKYNTLSGLPVVDRWKSWENFKKLNSAAEEPEVIRLLVTVEDTGVGIPLESQNRIFTPFMQADSSTSRTYGGTGIGLSISKCLVDLMHGEIGFVSTPGVGSTFSFTGALRKRESRSIEIKYDPVFDELRGRRALVVDDRSIRAEVTRYHLQELDVSVDIASSLKSACKHLSSTSTSSASTNLAMVFIDKDAWDKNTGILFQCLLKGAGQSGGSEGLRNLPKIFLMTTSKSTSESVELKSAGLVDHVLRKPLLRSVLVACIKEAFGSRYIMSQEKEKNELSSCPSLLREKRVLVVDDNVVNRKVAQGALKKYGANATCVESGKAAVTMLTPPHNFDACFMDLQMPEINGFEATRLIRCMESEVNEKIASGEASPEMFGNVTHWHTPILAMTADLIQASNEVCKKHGMDDYVSKPFEYEQMYRVLARFFHV